MQTLIANKFYQVGVDIRNVGFIQTWEIILKQVHVLNKREMWLPFWVDLTFEQYEDAIVFREFFVTIFV